MRNVKLFSAIGLLLGLLFISAGNAAAHDRNVSQPINNLMQLHGRHHDRPFIGLYLNPDPYAYPNRYSYYNAYDGHSCGYYRHKWQVTGSPYWHRRYQWCLED